MKKILVAFHFLTIIPLREIEELSDQEVGSSTSMFPIVGIVEGAILTVTAVLSLKIFPAELTNGLIIMVMVLLNGCLHIDGLADTFDAIASRGEREKKLAIMRDSSIGAAGVTAIVLVLLLKYLLLNALFFALSTVVYYTVLFLMPVLARWVIVPAAFHGRSARTDGLGRKFIEFTGKRELFTATGLTVFILAAACIIASAYNMLIFLIMFAMPVLYMFSWVNVWFCNGHFSGMTGDTIGTLYELSVLLLLMTEVIWSQRFI